MRANILRISLLVIAAAIIACSQCNQYNYENYDRLATALGLANIEIQGVFDDEIPQNLNAEMFLDSLKAYQYDLYEELKGYEYEFYPRGYYYIVFVMNPITKKVIMYDYSCESPVDGLVYKNPTTFDKARVLQESPCPEIEPANEEP